MRISIPKATKMYNEKDPGGWPRGTRAFRELSHGVLLATTKNYVKYVNKRVRSMIDKGYVTQAILSYAKHSGRFDEEEAKRIQNTQGPKAYRQYVRDTATLYVSKKNDENALLAKLDAAIHFRSLKTSTIRGEKRYRATAERTLKSNYGLDFKNYTNDQIDQFWSEINELASDHSNFAAMWNLGSKKPFQEIVNIINDRTDAIGGPINLVDAVHEYYARVNDQAQDSSHNPNEAFHTLEEEFQAELRRRNNE